MALKQLVGRNIAAARADRGWTQTELAQTAGVRDDQQISKWERGVYLPSGEALLAIAAAFGRDVSWFYIDHDKAAAA